MKKINDRVYHYIEHVTKIEYFSYYVILYSGVNKYLYIDKKIDTGIYDYIASINFSNYISLINEKNDNFGLFLVESHDEGFIDVLSNLSLKSSKNVINSDDDLKNIYDSIYFNIDDLYKYYLSVQDKIEEVMYPSQSQYYLIINISLVYHLLDIGKFFLDKWMNSDNSIMREVLFFKDISYHNFIDGNIVLFEDSRFEKISYFLDKYYKSNYLSSNLFDEIDAFISSTSMSNSECFLFYSLIAISRKIDMNSLVDVNSLNYYVQETYNYLLKKYKEHQESD